MSLGLGGTGGAAEARVEVVAALEPRFGGSCSPAELSETGASLSSLVEAEGEEQHVRGGERERIGLMN